MQSIPERRPRRVVSDEEASGALWDDLWARLRADRRYQAIVRQDLAPRWRRVLQAEGWRENPLPDVEDILDHYVAFYGDDNEPDHPTRHYVVALLACVFDSLRLTERGYWSIRAAGEVHDDVTGRTEMRTRWLGSPRAADDDRLTLSLTVSANHVRFEITGRDSDGTLFFSAQDDFGFSRLGLGYDPEHWRVLEHTGCGIVQDAVARIRHRIEATHPALNAAHIDRWPEDLDLLVRCLFHREPLPDKAARERLRRLCARLGLDFRQGSDRGRPAPHHRNAPALRPEHLIAGESETPPAA